VHDATLRRHAHRARSFDGAVYVLVAHLTMTRGDGDNAAAVLRCDVSAGDADDSRIDGHTRHLFSHVDGFCNRLGGAVDLDHSTFAHASRDGLSDSEDAKACGLEVGGSAAHLSRS